MSEISLSSVRIENNSLEIQFTCSTELDRFFKAKRFIFKAKENLSLVPESIAVIPLIVQLLPIVWITDSILNVNELDADFYNSIDHIKEGYVNMYPMLSFKGGINVGTIKDNSKTQNQPKNIAILFSGGLDAFSCVLAHISENPILIGIHGADIPFEDEKAWVNVASQLNKNATVLKLNFTDISSNFAAFLNHHNLNTLVANSKDNWWHGFQHGIGMLGLIAPLAFNRNIKTLYIASSHTIKDKVPCASDPTIDNYIEFCGCHVKHDQYHLNRFQKTSFIVNAVRNLNLSIPLRVCYKNKVGENCCICEKCLRTATALAILGENPLNYGFNKNDLFKNSKNKVIYNINYTAIPLWEDMKSYLSSHPTIDLPANLDWVKTTDIKKITRSKKFRLLNFLRRRNRFINKILLN